MCPHCNALLNNVNIKDVNVRAGINRNEWRGIAYICPFCQKILSVAIDPIAIKTDIVDDLFGRLQG